MSALDQAADFTLRTPHAIASATSSDYITLASLGFDSKANAGAAAGVMPAYLYVHADGAKVALRFGAVGVVASLTATSTVVSNAVTVPGATVPHVVVESGQIMRVMVPEGAAVVAHVSSATGGYVRLTRAS